MRIVVVNNFFPPRPGGSAHLSEALAKGYAAAGHQVLVITAAYRDLPAEEERDGLRIVRLPAWTLPRTRLAVNFDVTLTLRPSLRRRLCTLLSEFRPDVLHQHGQFFDLTWATGWWARRHRVPVLLTVHTRLTHPRRGYHALFRLADALLVYPLLRRYKPCFVVLDVLMDEYITARYAGAVSGREYIPVGVDPGWLGSGDGSVVRRRHELGDRPVIVSLGHVIPQRGRLPLVAALPRILADQPDLAVLVVGHAYYDRFLARASRLGIRHAIVDVGAVPRCEVPNYLAAACLETHDLEGEGLGTATLESLAAGVPVVAAVRPDNFPGIELVDGEHLDLVPLGDPDALASAVLAILADPLAARARLAVPARGLVAEHFDLSHVVGQNLDALVRVMRAQHNS